MKSLEELALAHAGRPAFVMGGGESLPKQLERAPEGAIFISANQHGCLLRPCDYIVCCDDKPGKRFVHGGDLVGLRDFGAPIISPRRTMADYLVAKIPVNSSGVTAAWAAWVMGCAPILLGGMDCYRGKVYWHSPKAKSTGTHLSLSLHLNRWEQLKARVPGGMFRTIGGPLTGLFPAYDPAEPVTIPTLEDVRDHVAMHKVRVLKAWRVFKPGRIAEVNGVELANGLRKGAFARIP